MSIAQKHCGYSDTTTGDPCENLADENGRCWIPSHNPGPENDNPGRPTKLTHQRQERIAAAIESGHSFRSACEQAGISTATGHRWMSAGADEEEGVFRDFYDRITRARGVGIGEIERSIMELCVERQDPSTLLRYLQHIEGGYRSNEQTGGVVIDVGNEDIYEIDEETLEVVDGPEGAY